MSKFARPSPAQPEAPHAVALPRGVLCGTYRLLYVFHPYHGQVGAEQEGKPPLLTRMRVARRGIPKLSTPPHSITLGQQSLLYGRPPSLPP